MNNETQLTAKSLKESLWDTLQKLKDGKIDAREANAIAIQSGSIVSIAKLQFTIAKHMEKDLSDDLKTFIG